MLGAQMRRLSKRVRSGGLSNAVFMAVVVELLTFVSEAAYEGVVLRIILYMSVAWGCALVGALVTSGSRGMQVLAADVAASSL